MKYIKDALWGCAVGDALGVPVEFKTPEELIDNPVIQMQGHGTYDLEVGTWSDDTSMTLCTYDSLANGYDLNDMMSKFNDWEKNGKYHAVGYLFDIGVTTHQALARYRKGVELDKCGYDDEDSNGNGSLMRIMPICLYCINNNYDIDKSMMMVEAVSGLTHKHPRTLVACGIYYFITKSIIINSCSKDNIVLGIDEAFKYYRDNNKYIDQLQYFKQLEDIDTLIKTPSTKLNNRGYVVYTLINTIWALLTTSSYQEALLKAVNLGHDTDTVGAVLGALAGVYYGYQNIPDSWQEVIQNKQLIDEIIEKYNK